MGSGRSYSEIFQRSKPYVAMISLQFGYAGMNIITKYSLTHGMSHYVLVVYRHAFATLSIAPFALAFEWSHWKVRPKMTFSVFWQIFVLALLGPVIDQNFYYLGLKLTSPTFSCALSNMLPAMTFVLAAIFRMEKIDLKMVRCQAKVAGTVVTVAGAMLMTLYKGPIVKMIWTKNTHGSEVHAVAQESMGKDWFLGSLFVIIATLAWASLFILQAVTLKQYPAHFSLTTLVCFVGTLQAIVVTFIMEHKLSIWTIGFDMNLLAAAYAGIVTSSLAYYVQGLVMEKRGPVFASAFSPLMMIIVAIMGSFILNEQIYLGGILGGILIVVGLYAVLWGKYKENKEKEAMALLLTLKENGGNNNEQAISITEADGIELDGKRANCMCSTSHGIQEEHHKANCC
ncbi:WAT1-related protein At5g07050-like [Typha latifolia]|uniref:WAT1-related protein At5g07050-like n=1 Tax=Typha latifolia TaxID=4733 RepID=UPI003C2FC0CD